MATNNIKRIFVSLPETIFKMCNNDKCLYCIPVEKGCLAFAIISAIANVVALLASIVLGIMTAEGRFDSHADEDVHNIVGKVAVGTVTGLIRLVTGVLCILVGVGSLIGFIFSVLLCNGICNCRPGQVKAYFVYGVVSIVLIVIVSVIGLTPSENRVPGVVGLLVCVIYSLCLVLVHQTYTKLCADAAFKNHIQLVEDP